MSISSRCTWADHALWAGLATDSLHRLRTLNAHNQLTDIRSFQQPPTINSDRWTQLPANA
jgi:hypothetical protein